MTGLKQDDPYLRPDKFMSLIFLVTGKPIIMGGEGYPFVFRSFDIIAKFNQTLLDSRTSSPDYTSLKYWSEFGDFIAFSSQPEPQQNKLTENWAIVRFP